MAEETTHPNTTSQPQRLAASDLFAPVRDQLRIQGENGNWNYDAYMQGMYNGLECALTTLEQREPQYRSKPEEGWIHDRIPKDFVPQICDATLDDGANDPDELTPARKPANTQPIESHE